MKFNNRPVLAFTNNAFTNNALTHKNNSWWPAALLVLVLGWLCFPSEAQAATWDRKKPIVPSRLTATGSGGPSLPVQRFAKQGDWMKKAGPDSRWKFATECQSEGYGTCPNRFQKDGRAIVRNPSFCLNT